MKIKTETLESYEFLISKREHLLRCFLPVFVVWNCRKVIGVNCKTTKLKLSAKWKWINRERIKQFSTDINWTGKRRKF